MKERVGECCKQDVQWRRLTPPPELCAQDCGDTTSTNRPPGIALQTEVAGERQRARRRGPEVCATDPPRFAPRRELTNSAVTARGAQHQCPRSALKW